MAQLSPSLFILFFSPFGHSFSHILAKLSRRLSLQLGWGSCISFDADRLKKNSDEPRKPLTGTAYFWSAYCPGGFADDYSLWLKKLIKFGFPQSFYLVFNYSLPLLIILISVNSHRLWNVQSQILGREKYQVKISHILGLFKKKVLRRVSNICCLRKMTLALSCCDHVYILCGACIVPLGGKMMYWSWGEGFGIDCYSKLDNIKYMSLCWELWRQVIYKYLCEAMFGENTIAYIMFCSSGQVSAIWGNK